jgi:hypothetical protein
MPQIQPRIKAKKNLPSRFWKNQVWKRRKSLLRDRAPWIALALALVLTSLSGWLPFGEVPIPELAGAGLSYAALSLGACVAGCTLALGIPGEKRLERWSKIKGEGKPFSSLSDLVFVFAWAAMAQVAVILVAFLAFVFGYRSTIHPAGAEFSHVTALFVALAVCFYALLELTAVIRTLVQVAGAIIREEAGQA